jgi:hypothetical protein
MMMASNALFTGIIRYGGDERKTQKNLSAADSLSASYDFQKPTNDHCQKSGSRNGAVCHIWRIGLR